MRKKIVLFVVLIVMLLIGWSWRYVSLNKFYQNACDQTRREYLTNDIVYFEDDFIDKGMHANGYWIRVDDFEIIDYQDYIIREKINLPDDHESAEKIALVYVTLCNESSKEPGVMLTEFVLRGIDCYSNMNWNLLLAANEGLRDTPGISLSCGREYSVVLPYNLKKDLFSRTTWNNLDEYEFFLRVTFFPTAKEIKVQ